MGDDVMEPKFSVCDLGAHDDGDGSIVNEWAITLTDGVREIQGSAMMPIARLQSAGPGVVQREIERVKSQMLQEWSQT